MQGYLSSAYQQQAQTLHNYYLPIEKDESISLADRKQAMLERWIRHTDLLVQE